MADKNALSGLILEGTRFADNKLTFKGKLRIDGEFVGEIESDGQLIVGKTAKIDAQILVREVLVAGEVKGKIKDCHLLEIQDGGRVLADVEARVLDVKAGAIFHGSSQMIPQAAKTK